jgi:hypothetical protein
MRNMGCRKVYRGEPFPSAHHFSQGAGMRQRREKMRRKQSEDLQRPFLDWIKHEEEGFRKR